MKMILCFFYIHTLCLTITYSFLINNSCWRFAFCLTSTSIIYSFTLQLNKMISKLILPGIFDRCMYFHIIMLQFYRSMRKWKIYLDVYLDEKDYLNVEGQSRIKEMIELARSSRWSSRFNRVAEFRIRDRRLISGRSLSVRFSTLVAPGV